MDASTSRVSSSEAPVTVTPTSNVSHAIPVEVRKTASTELIVEPRQVSKMDIFVALQKGIAPKPHSAKRGAALKGTTHGLSQRPKREVHGQDTHRRAL